jgi:ABC-type branched-subunit amino acid transport system ATPase component
MLEIHDLSMNYGGVQALTNVSMVFRPGKITGIIGPNGAGKTTLFDAVTGFVRPSQGQVTLDGTRIDGQRPSRIARRGLVRTFQEVRVFDGLTVADNIYVAKQARRYRNVFRDGSRRRRKDDASLTAELPHMGSLATRLADYPPDLSFGERKRLEYVRLLASGAHALLLDEPASGLDADALADLGEIMQDAASKGAVVCVIEHNMDFVLDVCDYVYVLHLGELLAHGPAAHVLANEDVRRVYLGRERLNESETAPTVTSPLETHG